MVLDQKVREPWIVDFDGAVERRQQAAEGPAQIAEADQTDRLTSDQEGFGIAREAVRLAALPERPVGSRDAARQVEHHAERHLGHGLGEHRARVQNPDAAPKAGRIVDVGQEVALDVEDRPQLFRALEPFAGQVRLADHDLDLGQVPLDHLGRHPGGLLHDQATEVGEARLGRVVETHRHRARQRIDQNQRLARVHGSLRNAGWSA
jgi:hypothetical protein